MVSSSDGNNRGTRLDGRPDRRLAENRIVGEKATAPGEADHRFEKRASQFGNDPDPPTYPNKSKIRSLGQEPQQQRQSAPGRMTPEARPAR